MKDEFMLNADSETVIYGPMTTIYFVVLSYDKISYISVEGIQVLIDHKLNMATNNTMPDTLQKYNFMQPLKNSRQRRAVVVLLRVRQRCVESHGEGMCTDTCVLPLNSKQ